MKVADQLGQTPTNGVVELTQAEEGLVTQASHDAALGMEHRRFHLGFIAGCVDAGGQDGGIVVIGQLLVTVVDLRLVVAGFVHSGLNIIGDPESGDAAIELRHVDMALDPGGQLLIGESFGEGVIAGPQHGDKQIGGLDLAGGRIDPTQRFPRPVQEGLLSG